MQSDSSLIAEKKSSLTKATKTTKVSSSTCYQTPKTCGTDTSASFRSKTPNRSHITGNSSDIFSTVPHWIACARIWTRRNRKNADNEHYQTWPNIMGSANSFWAREAWSSAPLHGLSKMQCHHHQGLLPSSKNERMYRLGGEWVFETLEANSGYWRFNVDEESHCRRGRLQ